jgi:hypothetical protein
LDGAEPVAAGVTSSVPVVAGAVTAGVPPVELAFVTVALLVEMLLLLVTVELLPREVELFTKGSKGVKL